MSSFQKILNKEDWSRSDLFRLLSAEGEDQTLLFQKSAAVKEKTLGNIVYFRGLIEFSNICAKDCLYCGIRKSNQNNDRYNLSNKEIVEAAIYAHQQNYASIVLQGGELESPAFTERIALLLNEIHSSTKNELKVTLSLGEQSVDTYRTWFEHGAHRYLLRIESSDPELYARIHPDNALHDFQRRLSALQNLKSIGYQTGTGVMVGLPFQTLDNLIDDLLFMKDFQIDMVGMGPYIEHVDTPLYQNRQQLKPLSDRFYLTLKMIAILRLLMPKINIAAATALQAIDKMGREKAIRIGANVIMPNITPGIYRNNYKLYNNKPCTDENADDCTNCLQARIGMTNHEIGFGSWGDSKHFQERMG